MPSPLVPPAHPTSAAPAGTDLPAAADESGEELLGLASFSTWLARQLDLATPPGADELLAADLNLDQFALVKLVLSLDRLDAGCGPTVETVHVGACSIRDLHLYYLLKQQLPPHDDEQVMP